MVVLDELGDREPDYWITDMDPTDGSFVKIAEVLNTEDKQKGGMTRVHTEMNLIILLLFMFPMSTPTLNMYSTLRNSAQPSGNPCGLETNMGIRMHHLMFLSVVSGMNSAELKRVFTLSLNYS